MCGDIVHFLGANGCTRIFAVAQVANSSGCKPRPKVHCFSQEGPITLDSQQHHLQADSLVLDQNLGNPKLLEKEQL